MDVNKIKNILSMIFLGALGSGLWSLIGEPTAGFTFNAISSVGGWVGIAFGNFMNSGVGSGGWGDRCSVFFVIIFMLWFGLYITRNIAFKISNEYVRLTALTGAFLFLTLFSYKTIYSLKVTLYFDKNIEIIASKIDHNKFLQLRSFYRNINDLKSFNIAQDNVLQTAKELSIDIDRFSL